MIDWLFDHRQFARFYDAHPFLTGVILVELLVALPIIILQELALWLLR